MTLWGLGEVIVPLSEETLFHIHPEFPLGSESTADNYTRKLGQRVARAFATSFNGTDIYLILQHFTGNITLKEILQKFPRNLQTYSVDIIIWLMR